MDIQKGKADDKSKQKIVTRFDTHSMDYYFNRSKFNADEVEKERNEVKVTKELKRDMMAEKEIKYKNQIRFTKRTMSHYQTQKRAKDNNNDIDKYFTKYDQEPPRKRFRASVLRSDKEEMSD